MGRLMQEAADHFRRGHEGAGESCAHKFYQEAMAHRPLLGAVQHMVMAIKRGDYLCAADTIEYGMIPFLSMCGVE